ncbi:MAG: alpha-amylase family glycosyl hydrolase [Elusimicrobiota bacterium]
MKIKNLYPELEGGIYSVKTEVDSDFLVSCLLVKSGQVGEIVCQIDDRQENDKNPVLKYKKLLEKKWKTVSMVKDGEKYIFPLALKTPGIYHYTIDGYGKILEVIVEKKYARFAAWYEMFPRSQGSQLGKSATFSDCEKRLPDIKKMGFDVIYLPPIHPIGRSFRKGTNNSLSTQSSDPGCPWAIGNECGGHKSIEPQLGTIDDFRHFVEESNKTGIEIALDIALQCSPDHPYVKEHPEWFHKRVDGTIAYAENPPKKYEDIYPLNFYPPNKDEMWQEMKSIFIFWRQQGVTHFRVDNPHTKPTEFWKWLIYEVKKKYPDTVFLAEAFTNYEKLEELARCGFSQSYTYFTWRNGKNELIEYMLKLTNSYLTTFLRGNFFTNTPDICPPIIQTDNRFVFKMRLAIAATLSSLYGIYSGYELCDGKAYSGTEIYIDSEKYQYKAYDWNKPGNIKDYIEKINEIRRTNPALQYYDNLRIYNSTNDNVLFYGKKYKDNVVLVAANLNPYETQDSRVTVPVEEFDILSDSDYIVEELITGRKYMWHGRENYVRFEPQKESVYIFRIQKNVEEVVAAKQAFVTNELAIHHSKTFFELREKVVKHGDVYARRELATFFNNEILWRVYTSETYDENYANTVNTEAKKQCFQSIFQAYFTTPGH